MTLFRYSLWLCIAFSLSVSQLQGLADEPVTDESPGSAGVAFFEAKVRPILVERCYDCHSAESGSAEGELLVDSRMAIRQGGERGPAVVPHHPEASLLLSAVMHSHDDLKMPPKEAPLSAEVIADLRKWIEMGAPDPRVSDAPPSGDVWPGGDVAREHWAYQPPQTATPPDVGQSDWGRDELDRFILAKLEDSGLKPSPDAAPNVLLRRVTFAIVGLPPSPEELSEF
ncbi:MAG: DUF1549 domain-containing protein, partial [Planctomycetales bacterium]|nr:DUF1549 domain-containing protein [Planctomycetales bacterium]